MDPKFYLVGGAVRDHLLNRESRDRDFVVVGATPEWMIENGYEQVGASFPVYLKDGCEYALARQERKVGPGYHGFATSHDSTVTLEEDLIRRDLTINSMAMSDNGQIVDPYGGAHDLAQGILRHTSEAFADDPVRVLRLARFSARYGFRVAQETINLARKLVDAGELEHLPKERIWMELWKGLSEPNPGVMVDVLQQIGALDVEPLRSYISLTNRRWVTQDFAELDVGATPEQKFLMIMGDISQRVDLKTSNDMRIPKSLYRSSQMYCKLSEAWDKVLDDPQKVFEILEATSFISSGDSPEMGAAINVLTLEDYTSKFTTPWVWNLGTLNRAARSIKELDMVAITADKSNVKEKVRAAKLAAVEFSMGD